MRQNFITVCILLTPILISAQCIDCTYSFKENQNISLQSLISSQFKDQTAPKNLDQSLLLMKDKNLKEEDPSVMNNKERWEVILSKTHPYKAKFQHDRDKYKQKSRLIQ